MVRTPRRDLAPLGPLALVAEAEEARGNSVALVSGAPRRRELPPAGRARRHLDREAIERELELGPEFEWRDTGGGPSLLDRYTGVSLYGEASRGLLSRLRRDPGPSGQRVRVAWSRHAPAGPRDEHNPGTWATVGHEEWAVGGVEATQVHLATVEIVDDVHRLVAARTVAPAEVDRIFDVSGTTGQLDGRQVWVEWLTRDQARVFTAEAEVARAHGLEAVEGPRPRWEGTVPAARLEGVRSDLVEWSRDAETGVWG